MSAAITNGPCFWEVHFQGGKVDDPWENSIRVQAIDIFAACVDVHEQLRGQNILITSIELVDDPKPARELEHPRYECIQCWHHDDVKRERPFWQVLDNHTLEGEFASVVAASSDEHAMRAACNRLNLEHTETKGK